MTVSLIWAVLSCIIVYSFSQGIIDFYTQDQSVKDAILKAWYVLVIFVFFDCMQGVANGNISGLGIVGKVKFVTIFDYWVLGIPLSLYLMFNKKL